MEKMWGEPFRGGTTFSESFNACYENRPLRSGGREVWRTERSEGV